MKAEVIDEGHGLKKVRVGFNYQTSDGKHSELYLREALLTLVETLVKEELVDFQKVSGLECFTHLLSEDFHGDPTRQVFGMVQVRVVDTKAIIPMAGMVMTTKTKEEREGQPTESKYKCPTCNDNSLVMGEATKGDSNDSRKYHFYNCRGCGDEVIIEDEPERPMCACGKPADVKMAGEKPRCTKCPPVLETEQETCPFCHLRGRATMVGTGSVFCTNCRKRIVIGPDSPDRKDAEAYVGERCGKCGSEAGHRINCPDGVAFTGSRPVDGGEATKAEHGGPGCRCSTDPDGVQHTSIQCPHHGGD